MKQENHDIPDWLENDVRNVIDQVRLEEELSSAPEYPAESFEEFSEAPLDFEEMAEALRDDLEKVYELTGTLSRFSPDYPATCRVLEKMIRRLGSYCVTKAVLEQKGFTFPKLRDLDLKDLYCMVSFNFRKTRAAYHDGDRLNNCADMGLLALECRWVDLAEQLKATGEKIHLIRSGKIRADSILERAEMFKGGKENRRSSSRRVKGSEKAHSLPVLSSIARLMIAERKKALKALRSEMSHARPFYPPRPFEPSREMLEMCLRDEGPKTGRPVKAAAEASGREEKIPDRIAVPPVSGTPEHSQKAKDDKKARKKRRKAAAAARGRNR